jgi:hypothetical protein
MKVLCFCNLCARKYSGLCTAAIRLDLETWTSGDILGYFWIINGIFKIKEEGLGIWIRVVFE